MHGIYSVGDVIAYPGERKRILSGCHEDAWATFGAVEWLAGEKVLLEYNTSSARLQGYLYVAGS